MDLRSFDRPSVRAGCWLFLFACHFAGTLYYFPPGEVLGNPPIVRADYATHFYQAATVARLWRETGRAWAYDPHLLAGYPLGSAFELNNSGITAGTWLLSLVFDVPLAYNLVIVGLFVTLPLIVYAAASLMGLSPWARMTAVWMALALWYVDPAFHLAWSGGIFAFAIASGWALLALAACIRYVDWPARRNWIILAFAASVTVLLAPQIVIVLAVPLLVGIIRSASRWSPRQRLGLVAIAAVVLAVNAFWLEPFLRFAGIKTSSDQFLQAGVRNLIEDLAGTGRIDGGPPCRCGLRWLALGLTLWLWRRDRGRSDVPIFGVGAIGLFALAYLGSYVQLLADLQPYRFAIPASLLAVLPAASAVAHLATHPPRVRRATIVAGVAAAFLLARTAESAWYFRPHLSRLGEPVQLVDDRLSGPPPSYKMLIDWISTRAASEGRIMINDWRVGTLIPYYTGREVIGGPFLWTWIQHGQANAGIWDAFGRDLDQFAEGELRQAMKTYNVQWVITNADFDRSFYTLDDVARRWPGLLEPIDEIADFRIYRVPWPANSFLIGRGRALATYNRIAVRDASQNGVVLKYHWLPTLHSDPPLPLRAYPVPGDPVGFIQVDNGAIRDFTIYNGD